MKRFTVCASALLVVAAGGVCASEARAQADLNGTWELATTSAETAQRRDAIEAAVQDAPSFVRSRAREKLTARTTPISQLQISVKGDRVELSGSGRTMALTVGGSAVAVEGERGRAQATRQNGHLVITLTGDNGVRTTTYRLFDGGQRLVLDVQMTGSRRSMSLRYRVTYKRG